MSVKQECGVRRQRPTPRLTMLCVCMICVAQRLKNMIARSFLANSQHGAKQHGLVPLEQPKASWDSAAQEVLPPYLDSLMHSLT